MVKGKKGRTECCDKSQVKKGAWTAHEDSILISFIQQHGHNNWRALPKLAGLARCGKSCRLRWTNYLRPDVKRGKFTEEEEETILNLQQMMGNKWSKIASYLPGRTDNEIKNIWNSRLKKRAKPREQDSAEQSEDSPAINSSSSSSTKGKQKKRKTTESKTGDDDHRRRRRRRNRETDDGTETKMPRLSGDDTRPILPSNSSNSNNTYGDEFAALLFEDFVEPPDPGVIGNTQELEVNKPEIQEMRAPEAVEMPFKSDVEFWELLKSDGFNPFEEDKNGNNGVGDPENGSNLGETGTKEWLRYIENELGLEATAGEGDSDKEAKPGNPPEN